MNSILRFFVSMAWAVILPAQTGSPTTPKPYEDPEAYEVYSAILAAPQSGKSNSDLAVMSQRTLPFENCYKPDDQWRELLAPVVEDYINVNQTRWDLVDNRISFPHTLVSADQMNAIFSKGPNQGWKRFHRKYPHKALLYVSAVGFNANRTVAMVATESDCGPLCGSGGLSFLRKVDGRWQEFEPTGTICIVVH
jgi:hypothetical protein